MRFSLIPRPREKRISHKKSKDSRDEKKCSSWWVRKGTEEGECHCGAQKEMQSEMQNDVTRGMFPSVEKSDVFKRERKVGGGGWSFRCVLRFAFSVFKLPCVTCVCLLSADSGPMMITASV